MTVVQNTPGFSKRNHLCITTSFKTWPTYITDMDKSKFFSKEDSIENHIYANQKNQIVVDDFNDGPFTSANNIRININKSETGVARLTQKLESQGKTFPNALQNAQNINYSYQLKDSALIFSPRFQLKKGTIWRNQEVRLYLEVPVGTRLIIKDESYRYIDNYWTWNCDDKENDHNGYSTWIMTDDGLKCKYELGHQEEKKP